MKYWDGPKMSVKMRLIFSVTGRDNKMRQEIRNEPIHRYNATSRAKTN